MMIFPGRTPVAAPTHHSRELGRRVEQVVRDYQQENSDLTDAEIRTALLHSTQDYEDEGIVSRRRLRGILTGVAAAVIAGVAVMTDSGVRGRGSSGSGSTVWMVLAGTIAAVAIVIAVLRVVNRR